MTAVAAGRVPVAAQPGGLPAAGGAAAPHTFDMVTLIRAHPLTGRGLYGGLMLAAIAIGLAVKTPLVPFHMDLP